MEFLIQPMEMDDEMINALINWKCTTNQGCNYVAGCGVPVEQVEQP